MRTLREGKGTPGESFTQGWSYNDLGDVASLSYPRCVWASCNGASTTAPTVGFTYTRGWLTSVPGYANSISYHANGMVNQVAHGNGVVYTQALDPNAMRRPASYSTTGATTNWTSGAYTYDGAGNVAAIGGNSYLYDPVSRLTSASQWTGAASSTGAIATQGAAYDVYGNITTLTTNGSPLTLSTSASTNRLTGASFDSAGSMTWWNGNTYAYEPLGFAEAILGRRRGRRRMSIFRIAQRSIRMAVGSMVEDRCRTRRNDGCGNRVGVSQPFRGDL